MVRESLISRLISATGLPFPRVNLRFVLHDVCRAPTSLGMVYEKSNNISSEIPTWPRGHGWRSSHRRRNVRGTATVKERTVSEYTATIAWERADDAIFTDQPYSRAHRWRFDGGAEVPASSSPHIVPPPYYRAEHVSPEEDYSAALATC